MTQMDIFSEAGVTDHNGGTFYSEKNMSYLARVIDDIESGRSTPKEHELIDEVD